MAVFVGDDRALDYRLRTAISQVSTAGVSRWSRLGIDNGEFLAGAAPPAYAGGTDCRRRPHSLGNNDRGAIIEMRTRPHTHEESFDIPPERMFELLVTPSAIRGWWGASRVIVTPKVDGVWAAAWGDEDDPDYISTAKLVEYDPPRKMVMKYGEYYAKSGALPFRFADDALTSFTIEREGEGCRLRVEQTGFPCDPVADEFYAACETGWTNTFQGIRNLIGSNNETSGKATKYGNTPAGT